MNEIIAANVLFVATIAVYVVASILFLRFLVRGKGDVGTLGPRLIGLAAMLHAAHICVASLIAKVCPVQGIHFSMSVASMLMCAAYLVARRRLRIDVAGAFIAPLALTSLMASRFVGGGAEPGERIKSVILPFHVTLNLLGVALFSLAFTAASLYLVQERLVKRKQIDGVSRRLPPLDALDRAEHRFLLASFPLLTIGIVSGSIWARRVEMGATTDVLRAVFGYVAWLFIAGVLFLRSVAGWRGRRAAYGTIAGFGFAVLVLVVYLVRHEQPSVAAQISSAGAAETSESEFDSRRERIEARAEREHRAEQALRPLSTERSAQPTHRFRAAGWRTRSEVAP
ncbi:MAG: cytochrome c biogenesis protein CcsA [Polyangiaceae bacterium]|nr:cytochrome c biogenesis protein CcsA [Polyangiaceae bacterium]